MSDFNCYEALPERRISSEKFSSEMFHCLRMALLRVQDGLSFGFFAAQLMKALHLGCSGVSSGRDGSLTAAAGSAWAFTVSSDLAAEGDVMVAVPLAYFVSLRPL